MLINKQSKLTICCTFPNIILMFLFTLRPSTLLLSRVPPLLPPLCHPRPHLLGQQQHLLLRPDHRRATNLPLTHVNEDGAIGNRVQGVDIKLVRCDIFWENLLSRRFFLANCIVYFCFTLCHDLLCDLLSVSARMTQIACYT
jgi:hypothetical protein